MNQQNNIERLEQLLNNELTEAERQDLENTLAEDETLAQEFERRQTAHKMLDFMVSENLRAQLKDLEAEDTKVVHLASRKRRMYSLAIAASVIILIGAFFFIQPSGGNLSHQQMALNAYEAPAFTMRGSENQTISLPIAKGLQALNQKSYAEAIANLEEVSSEDQYYVLARYYLGHAHFLSGNYLAAESDFNEVVNSQDLRYHDEAQWFQLLSCQAQNQDCQEILQSILQNPNHPYSAQASEFEHK